MKQQLLTDDQLEQLDGFLMSPRTPAETMDIEMLDGFLVALAIGPEEVPEEEWLPAIFAGTPPEFDDHAEADEIFGLIRQHAASIKAAFSVNRRDNPGENPLYVPVILSDEDQDEKWQETSGVYWASGFFAGIEARSEAWDDLLEANAELDSAVEKILALAASEADDADQSPSDEVGAEPLKLLSTKERQERVSELPWHIEDVMYYVLEEKFGKVEQVVREEPKVGRNDPCHCGSGKKFKKCHGA
ncbi:UPF0149 family protein [Chitinibacter bivalviorum]|uniref:UPF0149 family protein n=1 Tax=Chitinibacter bivalviorum TaxID=2739434 RepID=A0A7H9BHV9_9NEIS|nr:UPF0149 family protein [Chitinibacter bivalviorum]QLG87531.1 UPF0149 family protein [Chitinibacter bivalviorum]